MNILVTGGCGFIGSNFLDYLLNNLSEDIQVTNLDNQTYAGRGKNLERLGIESNPNYSFVKGDICDVALVKEVFRERRPDLVFNFAAESHVDRSIDGPLVFERSNIGGAAVLLEAARKYPLKRFVQISTDEVYGSAQNGSFVESDPLNPSSPYAASKAGADLMAKAYNLTYKIPLVITRSANNYGPFQFPEKLLPLFITNLMDGKKVPLMWSEENPGLNVRDWLHVKDNCRAIWHVSQYGSDGEIYNIPGESEHTNFEITKTLLSIFGVGEDMIEKIPHRKGHDFRYSISGKKLRSLGFIQKHKDLSGELKALVDWYKSNEIWWRQLKDAS